MPLITKPIRRLLRAGAKKATTWGTAVQLSANSGLLLETLTGFSKKRTLHRFKQFATGQYMASAYGPVEPVDFDASLVMLYDPIAAGTLLAMLFGQAGTPETLGTGVYKHTFTFADDNEGLFATFVAEKPNKIWEVPSVKVVGATFSIADAVLKMTLNLKGDNIKDSNTTNTATQLDALTYPDRSKVVKFIHGSFRLNEQSGGSLDSESDLLINSVSISFKRPMKDDHVFGQDTIIEPIGGEYPDGTLKIGFPRMGQDNDFFMSAPDQDKTYKAYLKFVGPLISDAYYYTLQFFFPALKILPPAEYAHDEVIGSEVSFAIMKAASAPTGMSKAVAYIELTNTQSTDYLV